MEVIRNFPDADLLAAIRSGKQLESAVKAIYRAHFDSLSWYVLNNSGNREDAEDIFQEVVVSFINLVRAGKFRGESSIKTFLYSLNRFTWLNELKRRGRALHREEKFGNAQEQIVEDASRFIGDREGKAALLRILDELGDTCKKILLLFYYENLSIREILDQTDYETEQVVRNKKYKCLKQLEQLVHANPAVAETLKNLLHG